MSDNRFPVSVDVSRRRRMWARMVPLTLWWSAAAVLQAVVVAYAGWRLWPGGGNTILGVLFIGLGGMIIAANVAWLLTGGPDGRASILMRGG